MSIMIKHLKSQFLNVSQQQNNPPQILSWSADSTMVCAPLMVIVLHLMVEVFTQANLSLKIQRVIKHIKI